MSVQPTHEPALSTLRGQSVRITCMAQRHYGVDASGASFTETLLDRELLQFEDQQWCGAG